MMAMAATRAMDFSFVISYDGYKSLTCDYPSLDYESDDLFDENLCRLHSCMNMP